MRRSVPRRSPNDSKWPLCFAKRFLNQRLEIDPLRWYRGVDRMVNGDQPLEGNLKVSRKQAWGQFGKIVSRHGNRYGTMPVPGRDRFAYVMQSIQSKAGIAIAVVLTGFLCLSAWGQEAQRQDAQKQDAAKTDVRVVPGTGIPPRVSSNEYQAHAQAGTFLIG